jgi:hypothetical protein
VFWSQDAGLRRNIATGLGDALHSELSGISLAVLVVRPAGHADRLSPSVAPSGCVPEAGLLVMFCSGAFC